MMKMSTAQLGDKEVSIMYMYIDHANYNYNL